MRLGVWSLILRNLTELEVIEPKIEGRTFYHLSKVDWLNSRSVVANIPRQKILGPVLVSETQTTFGFFARF